jgi:group II intron reverse transcriptase/maturase
MGEMGDPGLLWRAWLHVRRRNAGPGVDGVSVVEWAREAPAHLKLLRRELARGKYEPLPLRGIFVPKPAGGWRRCGVPAVRDRVAQRAALMVLLPRVDPVLAPCSYAYRPGRSIYDALAQVVRWRDEGCQGLLDADIADCFESIDRGLLREALPRYVASERMRGLIHAWAANATQWPQKGGTRTERPARGIPQGDALSPLLCNVALDGFDAALLGHKCRVARYADDFVILARDREAAHGAHALARGLLRERGLRLNARKTRVADFQRGFQYLGTVFCGRFAVPATLRRIDGRPALAPGYEDPDARALDPLPDEARALLLLSRALKSHAAQGRLAGVVARATARALQPHATPRPTPRQRRPSTSGAPFTRAFLT